MIFSLVLIVLIAISCFVLVGAAFGLDARRKVAELRRRVEQLERQLADNHRAEPSKTEAETSDIKPTPPLASESQDSPGPIAKPSESAATINQPHPGPPPFDMGYVSKPESRVEVRLASEDSKQTSGPIFWWQAVSRFLMTFPTGDRSINGLFWLGGVVLTLGGLFLAKYTLDAGLLSPVARVLLGFSVGLGLIVTAEYLTRQKVRFDIHNDYLNAAIVSAGVITCYAMTLVASHYYQLISSTFSFIVLAAIALTATAMALRYGPIVAVIGILGAYSVPLPFWQLDYNVLTIASYVTLVSVSAIVVANQVQRQWLWWLSFAAHFIWFLIIVMLGGHGDALVILLFAVVSLYLYVLSDTLGWTLQRVHLTPLSLKVLLMPRKEQAGLLASLLPIWLFYFVHGYQPSLILATVVVLMVLCTAPLRHSAFDSWPLLGWLLSIATLGMMLPETNYNDLDFVFTGAHLYSQAIALALFSYALTMQRHYPDRLAYSLLLVVGPSSLFALCYIFSPPQANLAMYSLWAVELALLALVAERLTANQQLAWVKLSGILLANINVSLILTMLLESSTLTLALSAQLVGLGYWCRKLELSPPHWLVKALMAVVLIRLTLFPWLDGYSDERLFGIHWTIVIYPLVIGLFVLARRHYQDNLLRQIMAGAIMHLAALVITTESSYQLVGRYPNLSAPSFHEAILLAMNWLLIAAVYCYRSQYSTSLQKVYLSFAALLALGAGYYHIALNSLSSPWFAPQSIGETPLWNWLLALWLIPALILLAVSRLTLFQTKLRRIIYGISAVWLLQFINGTIRHQFHQDQIWVRLPTEELEMYSYSLVWLVISVVTLVAARRFAKPLMQQIGFGLLAIVVCKAFLVDMSQLTGLYRALSFLGLGVSLLGIGWLVQRMKGSDFPDAKQS
ncbi:DUF2339 domain-containing protein [Vibrio sp.]|uniref:DUF2339 domain-containing protein n=1 Tax=Vibrio sp. TaxID=678 RepID=UPI003D12189D